MSCVEEVAMNVLQASGTGWELWLLEGLGSFPRVRDSGRDTPVCSRSPSSLHNNHVR